MFRAMPPQNFQNRRANIAVENAVQDENQSNAVNPNVLRDKLVEATTGVTTRGSVRRSVLGDVSNVQPAANQAAAVKQLRGRSVSTAQTTSVSSARAKTVTTTNAAVKTTAVKSTAAATRPTAVPSQSTAATTAARPTVTVIESQQEPPKAVQPPRIVVPMPAMRQENDPSPHQQEEDSIALSKRPRRAAYEMAGWDDLDLEDAEDPLMVSEYVNEIFLYMLDMEAKTMPNPNYIENQKELQWKMRSVLVDWLIEVHWKFKLLPETLYLTVNIIDRFLSLRVVSLVKLQLVGIAAMLIASKYEEIMAPSIANFVFLADGGYDDQEILRAERYVLGVLGFSLGYPSPMVFLRRISKADNYDIQTRTMAKYLMEVTLIDERFIAVPPSLIAAVGIYLARKMLNRSAWDANLTHYSAYTEAEILEPAEMLMGYLQKPTKYEAVFKKYASRKFLKVSLFVKDYIEHHVTNATSLAGVMNRP